MANHQSAEKRIRRNTHRAEVNGARVSRIRTYVKAVELAIASGDKTAAEAALRAAQPEMARGVRSGVLHRNTMARKMSRLVSRVRSEEHTSELQSLMRISYAVFCLKKTKLTRI